MTAKIDANKASEARTKQRTKILDAAHDMARSGRHKDHLTILRELEILKGFLGGISAARVWLGDPTVLAQLDNLCTLARASSAGSTGQGA